MSQPRACAALASILLVAACGGSSGVPPTRVYPSDGGNRRPDVTVVGASLIEDALVPRPEQVRVELTVANVGDVAVTDIAVQEGRIEASGLDLALNFDFADASAVRPLSPGETRRIVLVATLVPLGICTDALLALPNPHNGVASVGLTLLSSAGGRALGGIDVAVTCDVSGGVVDAGSPPEPPGDASSGGGMDVPPSEPPPDGAQRETPAFDDAGMITPPDA